MARREMNRKDFLSTADEKHLEMVKTSKMPILFVSRKLCGKNIMEVPSWKYYLSLSLSIVILEILFDFFLGLLLA